MHPTAASRLPLFRVLHNKSSFLYYNLSSHILPLRLGNAVLWDRTMPSHPFILSTHHSTSDLWSLSCLNEWQKEGGKKERGRGKKNLLIPLRVSNPGRLNKASVAWGTRFLDFSCTQDIWALGTRKVFISKTLLSHLSELSNTVHLQS